MRRHRPAGLVAAAACAVLLLAPVPAHATHADIDQTAPRVAGATRVHTAVEVSRSGWPAAHHAVVATARAFPDALGGTALAAALDAPLLLSEPGHLPGEVAAELVRLRSREVVILGGTAAITPAVEDAILSLPSAPEVRRVGGQDRWETAAEAARQALDGRRPREVALASGTDFPDALVSGALPGDGGRMPVLLSSRDGLPPATRMLLEDLRPDRALLIGGTAVLSGTVAAQVEALGVEVERLAGAERYATGTRVLEAALARSDAQPRPLVVATGGTFPDALAAGALVARLDGLLLLAPSSALTTEVDVLLRLRRARVSQALVVGGRGALAPHVRSEVAAALDGHPRPAATVTSPRGFRGTASPLPPDVATRMTGVSWHPRCPVGLQDLSLLVMAHRTFDGGTAPGVMVVHRQHARDVLGVFAALYDAGFPIEQMSLVDDYAGDDDDSMDANNTHAFNCRYVAGTTRYSEHAFGRAIDINPVQNPYVRAGQPSPPAGEAYLDRADVRPGMIVRPGPVVEAFEAIGWSWGGDWQTVKDYHHFSSTGR